MPIPPEIVAYDAAGKPLTCGVEGQIVDCEFTPIEELEWWNKIVADYAPGFYAFAGDGGGEMFAISPTGSVVMLPMIGDGAKDAIEIAPTWVEFELLLRELKI